MTEVLVYAAAPRAQTARALLRAACQATGLGVRLEVYGSGSLYQRLGPRHAPPLPDIVLWFGAFAAQAAASDGLLQPYQPPSNADAAAHASDWRWTTLDYLPIRVLGASGINTLQDLASVPGLAIADPERSEVGLSMVLATLDRARQADGDVERGWMWWQQRAKRGLWLAEDDPGAASMVDEAGTSHALSLDETGSPLQGVAPLPNAVGLASTSQNTDAAKHMIDWLTSDAASSVLKLSPWRAGSNGLQALLSTAPSLDVDWCRQQYATSRRRWSRSGFAATLKQ